ncbi:uncharacterized protein LOC120148390 [Hibiscus syriacus]|uniref:uncharacterized protein LOC120148390 n=1 Tax=Hibiscus syriacus TaxID=106335 RepID=UPI001920550B|nr:uncharacterized protein LOC120148390 [Hibiscus syriacus]
MDMSKFRPETSHVAQQSLRDKMRVQQGSNPVQHLDNFPNSLNPDLVHVRSVRSDHLLYDPDVFPSGFFHVPSSSNVLPPLRDAVLHQQLQTAQEHRQILAESPSFSSMSRPNLSKFSTSSKVYGDSLHNFDGMVGYARGSTGRESNQDPRFVGEVMSNNARSSNISAATQYLMPNYGNLHFASPSIYQNTPQDVVTSATIGTQELEDASRENQNISKANRGSRMDYCGNQANPLQFGDAGAWMNKPLVEHSQQWCGELATQGLSLSLSSNLPSKICGVDAVQFTEDRCGYDGFHSRRGELKEFKDSKSSNSGNFCSMQNPSSTGKANGKSIQDAGGASSNYVHRQTIPLGPFTGYATILNNSSFLKPARELLDEICHFTKPFNTSDRISGDVDASGSADASTAVETEAGTRKGNNTGASSSTFYCSNESCRTEYQQKKAKLVYMQEEVGNRFSFPI